MDLSAGVLPNLPLPSAAIALALCAAYVGVLWRWEVYTPPEVRHWQRLARLRGLDTSQGFGERVAARVPLVRRLREEFDIGLLLLIRGSAQTTEGWVTGTAAYSLGTGAVVAAIDAVGIAASGSLLLPLWLVPIVIAAAALLRYLVLRSQAANRQSRVADQLADALLGLAILVPGIPPEDALTLLARCQREGQLAQVLDQRQLALVLGDSAALQSTRDRYWTLGRALRIPLFQELSQLMRGIETEGLSPREEYPALSRTSADNRLSENRLRAARARTGAAAAIALLLVPLLIMVGGGIAFAFLGAVSG
jgi:hypothetical protein